VPDDGEAVVTATPATANVGALLETAVAAARAGGAVLVEGRRRPMEVARKNERTSIVTWADVTAQAAIVDVVTERFPDHAILAEEGGPAGAGSRDATPHGAGDAPTWLIDPLDGTSNYAHGVPFACTSVAVRDANGLAAGAVFDPFRGELFSAARGEGAWLDGERLAVSHADSPAIALVCTGVQSDDPEVIAAFGRLVVALIRHCRAVRCVGSPALCLAYVAAGRIDAFLERGGTYAWDVGAGALLIAEAGGRVEDLDGGPVNLGPGLADVLASNGAVHAALADIVHTAESGTRGGGT
jgi:myo-inositol-1(or 4)-monophosphatase